MTPDERAECQSNGSLMRASPLALLSIFTNERMISTNEIANYTNILPDIATIICNYLYYPLSENDEKRIKQDTNITNKNSVNQYCNLIFVAILKMLLDGKSKNECKDYYKSFLQSPCEALLRFKNEEDVPSEVKDSINDSLEEKDERNIVSKKGWVCNSFYIAFYAFWNFNSLESALKFIIKDHPGSDSDTNGSICGALFGAWLGFDKINQEVLTKQNIVKIDRYWFTSDSIYKLTPELFDRLKNMLNEI